MRNRLANALALAVWSTSICLAGEDPALERRVDETVREKGELESANAVEIRSPHGSKILSIVPPGTKVAVGDLLLALDSSSLEDQLTDQQMKLATSKASVVEAESALEAIQLESKNGAAVAELAVKVAELALERLVGEGGELALREQEADAELTVARERLKTTQRLAELAEAGVMAATSVPEKSLAAALAVAEAKAELTLAQARRNWLSQHIRPHETAALQLALLEAKLRHTRGQHDVERRFARAKAELRAAEAVHRAEEVKVARLEKQLAGCQVYAPRPGIVLYANPASSRGGRGATLAAGSDVRQHQLLLRVVDMKRLRLRVSVHESRINRVRVGQPATIRFDALPSRSLSGRVVKVSSTPEPTSWLNGDVKEYSAFVSLDNPPPGLRLGMTAVAEIDVSAGDARSPRARRPRNGVLPTDGNAIRRSPGLLPQPESPPHGERTHTPANILEREMIGVAIEQAQKEDPESDPTRLRERVTATVRAEIIELRKHYPAFLVVSADRERDLQTDTQDTTAARRIAEVERAMAELELPLPSGVTALLDQHKQGTLSARRTELLAELMVATWKTTEHALSN